MKPARRRKAVDAPRASAYAYKAVTTETERLLARYHAREVLLEQLQRRLVDARESLARARKKLKKLKGDKLTAAKASAQQDLDSHIAAKTLPLFGEDPEHTAKDSILSGIALLFEQQIEIPKIRMLARDLIDAVALRFASSKPADSDEDDDGAQVTMFAAQTSRRAVERDAAWMLAKHFPRPDPFSWQEVVAHLDADELAATWRWCSEPTNYGRPTWLAAVEAGQRDRFEKDPKLPAVFRLLDDAAARIGKSLSAEIDEQGRVHLLPRGEGPIEIGKIEAHDVSIASFVLVRMVAEYKPEWSTSRDEWTWRGKDGKSREEARQHKPAPTNGPAIRMPPKRNPTQAEAAGQREAKVDEILGKADLPTGAYPRSRSRRRSNPRPTRTGDPSVDKLKAAMRAAKGNIKAAGEALGLSRDAMRRRLQAANLYPWTEGDDAPSEAPAS